MKIVIMILLMVGVFGCELEDAVSTEQRFSVIVTDSVELIETYRNIDYKLKVLDESPASGYKTFIYTAVNHFDLFFDVYDIETGIYIKTININTNNYEYGYLINIDNL